jgi:tRNA (cytidine/uridine-2'-O-)-methyltransferase
MLRIALIHPDIPQNTGNIGRLCVGLDAELHLVEPMGFILDDKRIRKAGLDYWQDLKLVKHNSLEAFLEKTASKRLFFLTTKTSQLYTDVKYQKGDFLVLGSESKGLPEQLLEQQKDQCVTIPMPGKVRSLNVSNATSVVAYEAYRQISTSQGS